MRVTRVIEGTLSRVTGVCDYKVSDTRELLVTFTFGGIGVTVDIDEN